MRSSKLVGLRRSAIDLRERKIRVTEQLIRLGAGQWLRKKPKTKSSIRSITISTFATSSLADHLKRFAQPGSDGLVFVNGASNPLIASSFQTHYFGPALQQAGITCRFHDLRHTSVALAIASGAHPKAIQSRMGHSSINVTFDRYGHLFPEFDEAIAASFDKRFAEAHAHRSGQVVHVTFGVQ
jgi:integrase